jgi:hypothetical protein
MKAFLKEQNKILDDLKIVHHSINLNLIRNKENLIKKKPSGFPNYKNVELETFIDYKYNGSIIPLGEIYNLIGIDVDNKQDTINKYNIICEDQEINMDTLTVETVNKGYHYYYKLTKKQKDKLKNFNSSNDMLYNLKIDVKYNNQCFFGPSYISFEEDIYKYNIINYTEIALLPCLQFCYKPI